MKNTQKGSVSLWLVAIIIILVGVVGYFVFMKKPMIENQQITNSINTNSLVSTSSTQNNFTNVEWQTYSNPKFNFQIKYPIGTQIKDVDITGGRAVLINLPQYINDFDISPFVEIDVQSQEYGQGSKLIAAQCNSEKRPNTIVSFNGVEFIKTDISSDFDGMQGNAIAQSYCVMNNGIRYRLVARISYSRGSIVPDKKVYFPKFDQLIKTLEFKTI